MNEIYDTFLKTLTDIYDANFTIREYILKDKDIKSPWISKGLKKFSKTKQRLYNKFLKTKTLEDESKYKNYKSLFEKLRKKAKIAYYSKLLHKYKTDSKRTWQVMKEVTGKQKRKSNLLPEKLKLIKALCKTHKRLLKNSTNFLLLLDQHWWEKSPILKKHLKTFGNIYLEFL